MIEYIKYYLNLTKLFKNKERIRVEYTNDIRRAKKEGKSKDSVEAMKHQLYFEIQVIDEEISILVTNYLIRKANRRFIPIPSHDEFGIWEQCDNISNRYVLTNLGISNLRSSIRIEQKEQNEMILTILAALTGIIGAATGFVSILVR